MNKRFQILFGLYLDGTITPPEKKELLRLISDPANEKLVNSLMDNLWENLPDQPVSLLNREEIFSRIKQQVDASLEATPSARKFPKLKVAAAIGLLAMFAIGFFLYTPIIKDSAQEVFAVNNHKADPQFLRLPDGSTVLLNEGSKLEYPTTFDGNTREVYLQGEGFFDIQHDPSKPFLVKTADVTTTVLGTAFNIRAFPSDRHITVTVTRGKVKVSKDKKVLGVITHDQQLTVERQTAVIHQANVNSKETTGWMERDIHFNDVTMEDAVAELSNRFGVQIQLNNDQLRLCKFTATFVKGEDIEQILVVITEFNNATFTHNKITGEISITGTGCTPKSKT
jgi:transmembrane sensor